MKISNLRDYARLSEIYNISANFAKDEGLLAENLVFLELKRRGKEPFYWKKRGEVDFVIKDDDGSLTAINVSYTDVIDERVTRGLLEFAGEFETDVKELLLLTRDTEGDAEGVRCVPVWKWCLGW